MVKRSSILAALLAAVIIIDGDTSDIVDNASGVANRIRIENIDTPETFRPRCERELILGLQAKQRLRELLDSGTVTFTPMGTDRFNRMLARVYIASPSGDTIDVGSILLKEGHALPWAPGPAAKAARLARWCP